MISEFDYILYTTILPRVMTKAILHQLGVLGFLGFTLCRWNTLMARAIAKEPVIRTTGLSGYFLLRARGLVALGMAPTDRLTSIVTQFLCVDILVVQPQETLCTVGPVA